MEGDLHIHTSVSDGSFPPPKLVQKVIGSPLGFFAVTDHNSVAGLREVERCLPAQGPRFIGGVELSAQPDDDHEIHVLGYGTDPGCPALNEVCRQIQRLKKEQVREIAERLRADGVEVDLTDVSFDDEEVYMGRPVLADLLVKHGIVNSVGQAFGRYLGREARAFVRMGRFSPQRCIEAIHEAGGLAVLAHPFIETLDRWVEPLARMGLDGVEAYRPRMDGNEELYAEKAAEHFGLFVTGGSDWHGRDGEPPLGAFAVPEDHLAPFFEALASRRRERGQTPFPPDGSAPG